MVPTEKSGISTFSGRLFEKCHFRSRLPLKKLYAITKHILEKMNLNQQVKKKGRPKKYEERFIIAFWLFQIFNKRSYRKTFDIPSLSDYHYRVKQLDEELLRLILKECAKLLLEDKQIKCYIADKVGSSFNLLREDLARKMAIACAILWNFWLVVIYFLPYTLPLCFNLFLKYSVDFSDSLLPF